MSAPVLTLYVETAGNRRVFKPAEVVIGALEVQCATEWTVETFNLVLLWRTDGKGNVDKGAADSAVIRKRGERMPITVKQPFSLRLPPHPVSTLGSTIRIYWLVGLYVRAKGGKEQFFELPIASTFQEEQFKKYFDSSEDVEAN
ncbi:MAG: hypothetical protein ABI579_05990 [Candidatus Sumerlaeota bacterium]